MYQENDIDLGRLSLVKYRIYKDIVHEVVTPYKLGRTVPYREDHAKAKVFYDDNGEIITQEAVTLNRSLRRSKQKIRDLILCNDWSLFITLTINAKKCDSTKLEEVLKRVQSFERYLLKYECKFLLVPEYHADKKKIHLHGLLSGDIPIVDSGTVKVPYIKKPLRLQTAISQGLDLNGAKKVYNLPKWKYGFATAIKVGDNAFDNMKLANYVSKYISKDLITVFGKHRYWCSTDLRRPVIFEKISRYTYGIRPDSNFGNMISCYKTKYAIIIDYLKPEFDVDVNVPDGACPFTFRE